MRAGVTQQSPTFPAKVTVVVDGDTYTDSDRLLRAYEDEQAWGGQYIIELDNADDSLSAKDYKGKAITINNAFQTGGAGSNLAPLWVHSQGFVSKEGKLRLMLNCIDVWVLLGAVDASVGAEFWNYPEQAPGEVDEDLTHYGKTIRQIVTSIINDAIGIDIVVDDADDNFNQQKPPIRITNARTGVRQLMEMTGAYLLWKSDSKFHVIVPSDHSTVYNYNLLDLFFSNVSDEAIVIPNRVVYYGTDVDGNVINGSAIDAVSYARLGMYIDRHLYHTKNTITLIKTEAACTALAEGTLSKMQGEKSQGILVAPMHCSQELFDKIGVLDSRYGSARSTTGYVHRIIREYDRGVYKITIFLGGVTSGYTPEGGSPPLPLANPDLGMPPFSLRFDFLPAYLPVVINIEFTAEDWDTVSWDSGTIQCADGTVFSVNSGSLDLANADVYYLYYEIDNPDLQNTQTFNEACSAERILVGFLKRGATIKDKALIVIGSQGKDLFIDVLSAITANLGLINAGEIRLGTGDLNATTSVATGGSTTTLEDSEQAWDVNGLVNKSIRIVQSSVIHERTITANTATEITFTPALDVGVTTETYYLGGGAFTGWRLWEEANLGHMAGFNAGDMQFYVGSDGKLYAANGGVRIDEDGIRFTRTAPGDATFLKLYYGDTYIGYLAPFDGKLYLVANAGNELRLGGDLVHASKFQAETRLKIPVGEDMYD